MRERRRKNAFFGDVLNIKIKGRKSTDLFFHQKENIKQRKKFLSAIKKDDKIKIKYKLKAQCFGEERS